MIFFSRSDLPFFHSSPESHGLDDFVDQVVVMMLERGKKRKTNGEKILNFCGNWERVLEEERNMVFLALGFFYLPDNRRY